MPSFAMNTCSRRFVPLIHCIIVSQGSVMTRCRCGGKYVARLVANLLLIPTLEEF